MKRVHVLNLLMFLVLILSVFITNHIIFIVISAIGLILGIEQFIQDKRELKLANEYARVGETRSIWKQLRVYVIFVSVAIVIYGILEFYKVDVFKTGMHKYYWFVLFAHFISDYYTNFIQSIRSFDDGIKLPGRNQEVIFWNDIEMFSIENCQIEFQSGGVDHRFILDHRDDDDLNSIFKRWNQMRTTE